MKPFAHTAVAPLLSPALFMPNGTRLLSAPPRWLTVPPAAPPHAPPTPYDVSGGGGDAHDTAYVGTNLARHGARGCARIRVL